MSTFVLHLWKATEKYCSHCTIDWSQYKNESVKGDYRENEVKRS